MTDRMRLQSWDCTSAVVGGAIGFLSGYLLSRGEVLSFGKDRRSVGRQDGTCCEKQPGLAQESDHKSVVAKAYSSLVSGNKSDVQSVDSSRLGYSAEEAGAKGDLGVGCGTPVDLACLQPGECVLDLGCGAGFDAGLAKKAVGEQGLVVGVDMLPEMLIKARENYPQVEFRLGEIEHLPAGDATFDAVISNCVINLSPDKAAVFKEVHRVLRNGGRVAISDIVQTADLPDELRTAKALSC